MTLTDAGPLVALADSSDKHHAACAAAARNVLAGSMITTWPCFTEASYLLGKIGGFDYQARLWKLRRKGVLELIELNPAECDRMEELMRQYQNVPMDLADASIVSVAESHSLKRLFTLDSDFFIYRLRDGSSLEIIP